jgi:hypothetical protein
MKLIAFLYDLISNIAAVLTVRETNIRLIYPACTSLMMASFYYQMKQYNTALYITSYALSKCTSEKVCCQDNLSDWQYDLDVVVL